MMQRDLLKFPYVVFFLKSGYLTLTVYGDALPMWRY